MSRKYLQTKKTTLSYSISDSETSFRLDSLQKLDGTSISASDIGDLMYFTIDPGTSKEEICSITSADVTVNADGTVDLVNVVRGLQEISPYSTGGFSAEHGAGGVVVFSNNPQLYNMLANLFNANTFSALNIFSGYAPQTTVDPVAGNDLVRLSYVQALVLGTLTTINVIVPGNAGETVSAGNLVYFDETDNEWKKTDADVPTTVNNVLLGIAQGAGTDGNPIASGILLQGVDANQSAMSVGDVQYASNTAGGISNTPGTTEVTVGLAKSATELYFKPRFNQMLTEDQQDALGGTSGTPSATNKYVTNDDTSATPTANKVARYDADGNLVVSTVTTTAICAETLAVGNPVVSNHYQADGGVAYEAKGTWAQAAAGASVTQSLTCGSGSNRILVVGIMTFATTPSPTYNGVAMTLAGSQSLGGGQNFYVYYLFAPATGANNLVYTNNAGNNTSGSFIQLTGSHQSAIDSFVSAVANSQTVTPTQEGSMLVHFSCSDQAGATPTTPVNFTANNQTIATGVGARILSGTSGHIVPKLPFTASSSTTVAVFSLLVRPITAPSYGYAKKTSAATATGGTASANLFSNFLGFVTGVTGGGVLGQTATIQVGGIVTGLSGLTPLATYYLSDTSATLSTSAGTNSKKIGIALSSTTLLIKQDNN